MCCQLLFRKNRSVVFVLKPSPHATPPEDEGAAPPARAALRASTASLAGEAASHRVSLAGLAARDPAFHAFLAAQDAALLAFSDSDGEAEGCVPRAAAPAPPPPGEVLTTAAARALCAAAAAPRPSVGSVARLLRAFRACAHAGDEGGGGGAGRMRVASASAFHAVVSFCVSRMDAVLQQGLLGGAGCASPGWARAQPLARSFVGNALHLAGDAADPSLVAPLVRALGRCAPLLPAFPRLARHALRLAVASFAHGAPAVRGAGAAALAALVRALPPPGVEAALRGAYRAFLAAARVGAPHAQPGVALMAAGVVDMLRADGEARPGAAAAYALAFAALRQAALQLRGPAAASAGHMRCLELWGCALCALARAPHDPLRPLVYPLLAVVAATARAAPSGRHAPLRLRLLQLQLRVASATGLFLPVAADAAALLALPELRVPPRAVAGDGEWRGALRVSRPTLRSPAFQAHLVHGCLDCCAASLASWAHHPSFPEVAAVPVAQLRVFARAAHHPPFRRAAAAVADAAAASAVVVAGAREGAAFAPAHAGPHPSHQVSSFSAALAAKGLSITRLATARSAAAAERAAAAHAAHVRIPDIGVRVAGADARDGVATKARGQARASHDDVMELYLSGSDE